MPPSVQELNKRRYIRTWRKALRELLLWPKADIDKWVERSAKRFDSPYSLVTTETPPYWIVGAIIPESLKEQIAGPELVRLGYALEDAILNRKTTWKCDSPADIAATRTRLNKVLARYGIALPDRPRAAYKAKKKR